MKNIGCLTKPFLKSADIAQLFDVKQAAVHLWVRKGKLKAKRTIGGNLRFNRDDVLKLWLEEGRGEIKEKRKEPRFQVDYKGNLKIGKDSFRAHIRNISAHGLGIVITADRDGLFPRINAGEYNETVIIPRDNLSLRQSFYGDIRHFRQEEKNKVAIGLALAEPEENTNRQTTDTTAN